MKKKYIIIIITILILLGIVAICFINKKDNKSIVESINLVKIVKEYSKLTEFDYKSQIEKNGHISKDDVLKIVAIRDKEYIKEHGVSDVIIELETNEKDEKYWFVEIRYSGYDEEIYLCYGRYKINYYTGEELKTTPSGPMNLEFSHMFVNVD